MAFKLSISLLVCSIVVFSIVCSYSYRYTIKPVALEDLPLLRPDISPIRLIPEDSGGIVFANQDRAIYNNLRSNKLHTLAKPTAIPLHNKKRSLSSATSARKNPPALTAPSKVAKKSVFDFAEHK